MAITVRPADLKADREMIISFVASYLNPVSNAARFDWLYLKNPHGEARAWIATEAESGLVVGMAAAFPRRVHVGGAEKVVWILGDFCIHDQHRSLGPALLLQRACLAGVDAGGADFCYDLPSASMMAVYRRLHISPVAQMLRLARPLRIDRKVRDVIKVPSLACGLTVVGNFVIGLRCRNFKSDQDTAFSLHTGRCGEEFSALAQKVRGQNGMRIDRSAEYLNWRYLDNPVNRYELLTARLGESLLGYAVFRCEGEDATLVDFLGVEDGIVRSLVRATVSLLWARGVLTVSAPMGEWHPSLSVMRGLGFRIRDESPIVVYSCSETVVERPWFLMDGDRDS